MSESPATEPPRLADRVAVVTGGASGIGRAVVQRFAAEGADVVIADIAEGASGVALEITAHDPNQNVSACHLDIADPDSVAAFFGRLEATHGRLDVLVNSAALTDGTHQARDVDVARIDLRVWRRTLDVDLTGTMLVTASAVPLMAASGGGSIVNISSNSALAGDLGLTAYAAAKAGVHSLTRSIATQYGTSGIRANVVSPGHIASPSFRANVTTSVQDMLRDNCLLPRLGTVDDVANAVLWLASDESTFVTGEIVRVDGGALAHVPTYAERVRSAPIEDHSGPRGHAPHPESVEADASTMSRRTDQ